MTDDAVTARARGRAERVADHPALDVLARVGLAAYGLVHLLIAVLAVRIAVGAGGQADKADKTGALQAVAATGAGRVLLWLVVGGLAALVVDRLLHAAVGHRGLPRAARVRRTAVDLAEAVVYALLAKTAADVAADGGADPSTPPLPSLLLALPGGPWLLGAAGLGVMTVAGYAAYRGLSGAFHRDLDLRGAGLRRSLLVLRLGRIGWTALGTVYLLSGGLLVVAAVQHDPAQPVGLDAALQGLAEHTVGPAVLLVLAAGLVVFAVYTVFHARHRAA
ncbi:DUF1206 domain-containing protein [Pseudonocardia sp. WMMC193]|uniref:DUF1206 domain-containing protein n=1 Tax=Pseudonocardia sp. WMMC193 TaxID=2911965 RepID=UPI001F18F1E0|nr:DUF1206 domain-containing protein [Pseudonocardia sp. WMMC193]MCF7549372.1 DUF1206 domain-containing protein [Pseudonocardia sp. WMMC193]